jgi:hypothetical protein
MMITFYGNMNKSLLATCSLGLGRAQCCKRSIHGILLRFSYHSASIEISSRFEIDLCGLIMFLMWRVRLYYWQRRKRGHNSTLLAMQNGLLMFFNRLLYLQTQNFECVCMFTSICDSGHLQPLLQPFYSTATKYLPPFCKLL